MVDIGGEVEAESLMDTVASRIRCPEPANAPLVAEQNVPDKRISDCDLSLEGLGLARYFLPPACSTQEAGATYNASAYRDYNLQDKRIVCHKILRQHMSFLSNGEKHKHCSAVVADGSALEKIQKK